MYLFPDFSLNRKRQKERKMSKRSGEVDGEKIKRISDYTEPMGERRKWQKWKFHEKRKTIEFSNKFAKYLVWK